MIEALNILIVAGDPLARSALAALCDSLPDFQVIGLTNPSTVVAHLADLEEEAEIDLLVWDLGWETSTIAPAEFQELDVPVLALLSGPDQAQEAWSAGASAILKREVSGPVLVAAATAAAHGLFVQDRELAAPFLPTPPDAEDDLQETLTPREMEVLLLLAEGLTNKAIATELDISRHTVKFHVNAILGKLNAQSRTEAVVRATRFGLLAL